MRTLRILAMSMIGLLAIAACSDTPDSVQDAVTSLPDSSEVAAVAAEVQTEMADLTATIQSSEAADAVETAWTEVQTEITAAIGTVTAGGSVDTEAINQELNAFQAELEAAGDEVRDDVMSAWTSLRSKFEQLLS